MIDYAEIARVLIERQLRIRPGEVVRIAGGLHNTEFVEEIAVAVRRNGGFPTIHLSWESLARRLVEEVPIEHLGATPAHQAQIEGLIDCNISVAPMADPGKLAGMDTQKLAALSAAGRPVQEASLDRGARRIGIGFPTPARAAAYGVSFAEYESLFWGAVTTDFEETWGMCQQVRERLRGGQEVRIVGPSGDELQCSIAGRRINMDDGVISDEDLETGDRTANLPFGEVYLAPVEESVNGVATYPAVFHEGQRIKNLSLVFAAGKLVDSHADENHELFLRAMEPHSGDKNCIGELGIGTNAAVRAPIGEALLDEKIYGSIHLALGENRSYGGVNASSLHWDMVMLEPSLHVDGLALLEGGRFTFL